jgi:hypothetical protein
MHACLCRQKYESEREREKEREKERGRESKRAETASHTDIRKGRKTKKLTFEKEEKQKNFESGNSQAD